MFTLQRLNVVRIVETEKHRDELIDKGFKDITPKPEEPKPADNKDIQPDDAKSAGNKDTKGKK